MYRLASVEKHFDSLSSAKVPSTVMPSLPKMAPDFSQWKMNHTMIRVKDPLKSIEFYSELGFVLIDKLAQPDFNFDLYFLAHDAQGRSPSAGKIRSDRQGILELTHNYGTEKDDSYCVSSGNEEPHLGLQHLGIAIDSLAAACRWLDNLNVEWLEHPNAENSHTLGKRLIKSAILRDPDGYHVELNEKDPKVPDTNINNYLFNFTGLRIKDPQVSLPWYADVLGMKVFLHEEYHDFAVYWLGYADNANDIASDLVRREGVVKLIWIFGSELKEGSVYHNGNNQPQGFGHLGKS